jgi:hypothetical protein
LSCDKKTPAGCPCQKIAPRGFEPLNENQQPVDNKALTQSENPVLATSLDKILQKHPDLAQVVERWSNLPIRIKAAIIAIVHVKDLRPLVVFS